MKRLVGRYDVMPRFYAISYYDYSVGRFACYPWGINIIIAKWRNIPTVCSDTGLRMTCGEIDAYNAGRKHERNNVPNPRKTVIQVKD